MITAVTPSVSSFYFTKDKIYPIRPITGSKLGQLRCDAGHYRVINLADLDDPEYRCPHLRLPHPDVEDLHKRDVLEWRNAGHWLDASSQLTPTPTSPKD